MAFLNSFSFLLILSFWIGSKQSLIYDVTQTLSYDVSSSSSKDKV